jgi:hypothetical protein
MMNEAKQMHRDLMNALLPILPRAVYHDIRRVVNLIWANVGLCMTYTVRLEAWSEILENRAHWLDPAVLATWDIRWQNCQLRPLLPIYLLGT